MYTKKERYEPSRATCRFGTRNRCRLGTPLDPCWVLPTEASEACPERRDEVCVCKLHITQIKTRVKHILNSTHNN